MAVTLVIGPLIPPPVTLNPLAESDVVTSKIAALVTQVGEGGNLYYLALGLAVALFILTVFTNLAIRIVRSNRTNVGVHGRGVSKDETENTATDNLRLN